MPTFRRHRRAATQVVAVPPNASELTSELTSEFSPVSSPAAESTAPDRHFGSVDQSWAAAGFAHDFSQVPVYTDDLPEVAPANGPGERRADAGRPERGAAVRRSVLAGDQGHPVDERIRGLAEAATGGLLDGVRVHDGPDDRRFAQLLGADAATHGSDVFLADGASARDEQLMQHELVHAAEGSALVQLRRATSVERRAWLGFFSHYLPRKFLNNYMDDTGTPIVLTAQEMQDCNPMIDIRHSTEFLREVARLRAAGGGSGAVTVSGWAGALTNGTLGNFTVHYLGTVTVTAAGGWTFSGTMRFHDYWDFDPKGAGSNRPIAAEIKVRVAHFALPGRPFTIDSVAVPVTQTDQAGRAVWGSGRAPTPVGDQAARTGVDIGAGGLTGGPAGAEVGAQSAEDLNR